MFASVNDKNISKKSASKQMNENKVKILSQTLIKAASLSSRKEFLNRVLDESGSKIKLNKKAHLKHQDSSTTEDKKYETTVSSSTSNSRKVYDKLSSKSKKKQENYYLSEDNNSNDNYDLTAKKNIFNHPSLSSDSNSGQMQFIRNIKETKTGRKDSKESSTKETNNNNNNRRVKMKTEVSDSNSSIDTGNINNKKQDIKSREYISDSFSSSSESGKLNKSDSSCSDSQNDFPKDNIKSKAANKKKKKNMNSSKLKNSSNTDSDSSSTSVDDIKKPTRKRPDIKSSHNESEEVISKKRKDSVDFEYYQESESEKLLKSFIKNNEYTEVVSKYENVLNMLSKDEEVYLVQIPKCIEPHVLIDKTISFDGPTKLKIGNESYLWNINHEDKHDVCIMNFNNLLTLRPKGFITMQQHFKSKNKSIDVKPIYDVVDVPNDLKVRHPLFGTEYKDKIELDEDILAKLEDCDAFVNKRHKKKSKKKHKKEIQSEESENLDIFKLLNAHGSQTKDDSHKREDSISKNRKKYKEKHESTNHDTENELQSMISDMFPEVKKHKKKKRKQSETSMTDDYSKSRDSSKDKSCLSDISKREETQLSMPTIDYKSIRRKSKDDSHSHDPFKENLQEDISETYSKKHKKKKKQKSSISLDNNTASSSWMDDRILEAESESKDKHHSFDSSKDQSAINYTKKKKRKSSVSLDNSTVSSNRVDDRILQENKSTDDLFSFDSSKDEPALNTSGVSASSHTKHKKKKEKKKHNEIVSSTMSTSIVSNTTFQLDESCIPKAKKKKHRKHRDSLDTFVDDLVKSITSNDDTQEIQKKKRKRSHSDKID